MIRCVITLNLRMLNSVVSMFVVAIRITIYQLPYTLSTHASQLQERPLGSRSVKGWLGWWGLLRA